jgi:hypothetical protein
MDNLQERLFAIYLFQMMLQLEKGWRYFPTPIDLPRYFAYSTKVRPTVDYRQLAHSFVDAILDTRCPTEHS